MRHCAAHVPFVMIFLLSVACSGQGLVDNVEPAVDSVPESPRSVGESGLRPRSPEIPGLMEWRIDGDIMGWDSGIGRTSEVLAATPEISKRLERLAAIVLGSSACDYSSLQGSLLQGGASSAALATGNLNHGLVGFVGVGRDTVGAITRNDGDSGWAINWHNRTDAGLLAYLWLHPNAACAKVLELVVSAVSGAGSLTHLESRTRAVIALRGLGHERAFALMTELMHRTSNGRHYVKDACGGNMHAGGIASLAAGVWPVEESGISRRMSFIGWDMGAMFDRAYQSYPAFPWGHAHGVPWPVSMGIENYGAFVPGVGADPNDPHVGLQIVYESRDTGWCLVWPDASLGASLRETLIAAGRISASPEDANARTTPKLSTALELCGRELLRNPKSIRHVLLMPGEGEMSHAAAIDWLSAPNILDHVRWDRKLGQFVLE